MTDFRAVSDKRKTAKAIDYITTVARRRRTALPVIPGGIIRNGRNVWRTGKADKAAFLVDGAAYFAALDEVLRQARHSIWIIGWDFNPDIRLRPHQSSETLGELLLALADKNPWLQIRILIWGMGPVYSGKSLKLFKENGFSTHPQISLRFDLRHPLRGCHHQKLVSIDDSIGFLGGVDLTARRWDEPDHRADNPLRKAPDGVPYDPVHDMQSMVSGSAARLIGDVCRRRWKQATGKLVEVTPQGGVSWPHTLPPEMENVTAAIALTEPGWIGKRGRFEAFRLTRDAINAARKYIYIETQYLASFGVARVIAKRLKEADGPEIAVLVTKSSHGLIEKLAMGHNRDRLIRRLKRIDRYDRLRVMYPVVPDGKGGEQEVGIHSKLIIVDDRFIRIGSSNLNNRSEGLDTECDLAIEAESAAHRRAITSFRHRLIAEHLDATSEAVKEMETAKRSLLNAIEALNIRKRGLRHFAIDIAKGETSPMIGTAFVDPRRPYRPLQKLRLRMSRLLRAIF
ncbi:phospholipase D-like domain-containing protein [Rhizobium gallicum]|uniref:Phospholipase D n=1 Tax=Rhizobium gallicum TaxID=56730 RepID=A0A1L5NN76_9HYPH|nr:phospholipase D-like domain-containing protein [Rhizobium gallicum]APO69342.1 phospholipase D-like domain-containing protein [Rhizobium gallicum]